MNDILDAEYVLITPVIHNLPGPESVTPDAVANCGETCTQYYCERCRDMHDCGEIYDNDPDCCKGAELCKRSR